MGASRTRGSSFTMCDYSLHHVKSRPTNIGEKLITRNFNTGTRGFASPDDRTTAVCILPGTELAFSEDVKWAPFSLLSWRVKVIESRTAIFRQVNTDIPRRTRICGWHLCSPDGLTGRSRSNGAATSGTAKNVSRGSSPEARHLRGLTLTHHPRPGSSSYRPLG